MKVAIPLAKSVLTLLEITAAASAIDAEIQKNTWFLNNYFNNFKWRNEWYDILKIVQAVEDSNILLKGVTIKLLTGKGIVRAGSGNEKGKGIVRAGTGKQWDF